MSASTRYLQPSRSKINLPTALNANARQAVNSHACPVFLISIALVALSVLVWGATSASAQLTFNIVNQGSATPQMMTGFAQGGALWSAYLQDPTTINIRVGASNLPAGVVGHSDIFFDTYVYSNVRSALVNDRLSLDDFSSTNTLQSVPVFSMLINRTANNPNGVVSLTPYFDTGFGGPWQAGPENNSTVRMPAANAKALGITSYDPTLLDGIIHLHDVGDL